MSIETDIRIKIGIQGWAVLRWYAEDKDSDPEQILYFYTEEPGDESEPAMTFGMDEDWPGFLAAVERASSALHGGL